MTNSHGSGSTTASADDVVICQPLRTPVGRFGGALAGASVTHLARTVLTELARRTNLTEGDVDDVILGQCYPNGEAPALGRIAALDVLGTQVPGLQVDRRCGSGLQAVLYAAMQVSSGASKIVVAGGAESMSQVEHYALGLRRGIKGDGVELMDRLARGRITAAGDQHPIPGGMLETAENVRREFGITRQAQDELAAESHARWKRAHDAGKFDDELVDVTIAGRRGKPETVVDVDEHPRPETTVEKLAELRPILGKNDPEATVTAGNSSGQNDGAAMCVVTTRKVAEEKGMDAFLRLRGWSVAATGPERMGVGPVPATRAALERAGLTLADLDLIELNEAFASQVLACLQQWEISAGDERVNPNGSGISLGHPVGATGGRILATLAHELRRRGGGLALETMCIGGGQGLAAIFEGEGANQ